MKKSNWLWGSKRIRDELRFLGINIHKKTISNILKTYGLIPPPVKFSPPSWSALLKSQKNIRSMDFTCVNDRNLNQIFILTIMDIVTRKLYR